MYSRSRRPSYEDVPCQGTAQALEEAMRGEATAIVFYGYLIEMAPDRFQKEVIAGIRNDERRHLNNFQAVYCRRTGCTYDYPEPEVSPPETYCRGLEEAFNDEQEAYEFYKANYFCNDKPLIKKAFLDALLDEAEHGRWFLNFLMRNGCFQDP